TTNTCGTGAPPAMGSTCVGSGGAEGTCQSMVCVPAGCGNSVVDGGEECDDGNAADGDGCTRMCRFTCSADGDCSDGNACNGLERCSMPGTIGSRCAAPMRVRCDDGNACTTDACNPATGCVATLIDADRDGEAPASLSACGTDCDDTRATVCSGCGEICGDGLDNDCDGTADNGLTTWFADCDGDGYAAAGAVTVMQCSTPAPSATGCGTGAQRWVTRNPATGPDCDDGIAAVHPSATETAGNERDDNCDGRELCYRDSDGDGYRTSGTSESLNTSCRDEGEARAAIPSGDCCDSDDRAHPGATAYYPAPRAGCGGYDYNCNGSAELQLRDAGAYCVRTGTLACSAVGTGWAGTATPPPCGGAAYFISGPASCTPTGTGCAAPFLPQSCR
ncbi:MAG: hypothetical protein K8H88_14875, partial [Sandaracinaceae bacterium]|nr:hypothetical protein [Sandaracinaceae bacterium]